MSKDGERRGSARHPDSVFAKRYRKQTQPRSLDPKPGPDTTSPPRAVEVGPTQVYTKEQILDGGGLLPPDPDGLDLPTVIGAPVPGGPGGGRPGHDERGGQGAHALTRYEVQGTLPTLIEGCGRFLALDTLTGRTVELRELEGYGRASASARAHVMSLVEHFERGAPPPEWGTIPGATRLLGVFTDEPRGPIAVLEGNSRDDLSSRLRDRGKLSPYEALGVGAEIARQLAALHASGAVHGHVSADLVFLDDRGAPHLEILTAILLPSRGPRGRAWEAPEVTAGRGPQAASDVYACAVLVAECLGGQVVGGVAQGLRDDIAALLATAMAPEPSARPSAAALSGLLLDLRGESPPPQRLPKPTILWAVGAATLLMAVALFLGVNALQQPQPQCPQQAQLDAARAGGDLLCQAYFLQQCSAAWGGYRTQMAELMASDSYKESVQEARRRVKRKRRNKTYLRDLALLHFLLPQDDLVQYSYAELREEVPKAPCP